MARAMSDSSWPAPSFRSRSVFDPLRLFNSEATSSSQQPETAAISTIVGEEIEELLNILPEREQEVIRMRFGMNGERVYTLEEVGQKMNLTRERIRQIESKALRRLRQRMREKGQNEYFE